MNKAKREKLVTEHMGLAYAYARHFAASNMEYDDLAQEGMVGLLEAADRFDPGRGVKFSTYAVWHIRKSIMEAIRSRNDTVRTPRRQTSRSCSSIEDPGMVQDSADVQTPEEVAEEREERESIRRNVQQCLRHLSLRDALVIQLRHAVNVEEPVTLRAVGAILDVTPERVRQIQLSAEEKLRKLLAHCATLEEHGAPTAEHLKESAQKHD